MCLTTNDKTTIIMIVTTYVIVFIAFVVSVLKCFFFVQCSHCICRLYESPTLNKMILLCACIWEWILWSIVIT